MLKYWNPTTHDIKNNLQKLKNYPKDLEPKYSRIA